MYLFPDEYPGFQKRPSIDLNARGGQRIGKKWLHQRHSGCTLGSPARGWRVIKGGSRRVRTGAREKKNASFDV